MERCGRAQPAARCRNVPILSRSRTIVFQVGHCLAFPVLSAVLWCDCWLQRRVFSRAEWRVRSLPSAEPGLGLSEMASGVGSSAAEPRAAGKTLPGFIFTRGVSFARSMVRAQHCTHFFCQACLFGNAPVCVLGCPRWGVCGCLCEDVRPLLQTQTCKMHLFVRATHASFSQPLTDAPCLLG